MNSQTPSPLGPMTLAFLAGAVLGGLMVAFTTPKSGPELHGTLKHLARHAKRKVGHLGEFAGDAWDEVKHRSGQATDDLKRGIGASIKDLQGKPAWTKLPAAEVGAPYEGTQ